MNPFFSPATLGKLANKIVTEIARITLEAEAICDVSSHAASSFGSSSPMWSRTLFALKKYFGISLGGLSIGDRRAEDCAVLRSDSVRKALGLRRRPRALPGNTNRLRTICGHAGRLGTRRSGRSPKVLIFTVRQLNKRPRRHYIVWPLRDCPIGTPEIPPWRAWCAGGGACLERDEVTHSSVQTNEHGSTNPSA